jgi:hypothetical protein
MKKNLILISLLTLGLGAAWAQDATTLQVAPSDQVKYPDASQILNKSEPKAAAPAAKAAAAAQPTPTTTPVPTVAGDVPTTRPLVAAPPVLASAKAPAPKAAPLPAAAPIRGWFLSWILETDEAGARTWAQGLGRDFQLVAAGEGRWQVLAGPLDAAGLAAAAKDQGSVAVLVRR